MRLFGRKKTEAQVGLQPSAQDVQPAVDQLNVAQTGTTVHLAGAQVIDLRHDPAARAQFAPLIQMAEQMAGRDLDGDGKIGSMTAPQVPASADTSAAAPAGDATSADTQPQPLASGK